MQAFILYMTQIGIRQYVVPFPMDAHQASQVLATLEVAADIVYLWQSQSESLTYKGTLQLLHDWWQRVSPGGLLAVPRWLQHGEGAAAQPSQHGPQGPVASAVEAFAERMQLQLRDIHSHWVLMHKPQVSAQSTRSTDSGAQSSQGGQEAASGAVAELHASQAAALSNRQSFEGHHITQAQPQVQQQQQQQQQQQPVQQQQQLVQQQQQQIQSFAAAPPLACDPALAAFPDGGRVPVCPEMGKIRVNVQAKLVTCEPGDVRSWGNLLGPYWQGLAIAQLLGFAFEYPAGFREGWLAELPRRVEPGLACARPAEVDRICRLCMGYGLWHWPHDCPAGWPKARPAIRSLTRAAMASWAASRGVTMPTFEPGDALIQIRCARDTLLAHKHYGPAAFSFYTTHMPPGTKRVLLLYARHGHFSPTIYPPCERIVEALHRHLTSRLPGVAVGVVGGSMWEDYARMVAAPVLFRDAGSSWGLWAALASNGKVFSPPLLGEDPAKRAGYAFDGEALPYVDEDFVVVNTTVLYPALAEKLGLAVVEPFNHMTQIDRIIAWLESN